jgi:mRNA interferase HigB
MKIHNKIILDYFISKHANAAKPIDRWIEIVEQAECKNHAALTKLFPSTDYVGNGRYVFNIKGNDYRLVAVVVFLDGFLSVRFIGTHAEYDKINCSTI